MYTVHKTQTHKRDCGPSSIERLSTLARYLTQTCGRGEGTNNMADQPTAQRGHVATEGVARLCTLLEVNLTAGETSFCHRHTRSSRVCLSLKQLASRWGGGGQSEDTHTRSSNSHSKTAAVRRHGAENERKCFCACA